MEVNRTLAQIKLSILKEIPVSKNFDKYVVSKIEVLTNQIIEKVKKGNLDFSRESQEIDKLVYELYGLMRDEITML
jgi:hypothetical protein